MTEALPEHEILVEPAFHDLDPMGVVWHGNHLKYFERARCALLQTYNYDYPGMKESGYAWPVIECKCRYSRPITYDIKLKVKATIKEYENRLLIDYRISNAETGEKICVGYTAQVAVDMETGEMCFVSPDVLFERLGLERT